MSSSSKTNSNKQPIRGPILALDLGQKKVGVALSDELLMSTRRLDPIARSSWKQLLLEVTELIRRFDAQTLVIGLPLSLDGRHRSAADEAEKIAAKFSCSLPLPVYLQDERLSSVEARERLLAEGVRSHEVPALIDSESAVVILQDFLDQDQDRTLVGQSPIPSASK
jgi:putative Holliday junction resolvase